MGARLRGGFDDIRVVEAAGDFGEPGTGTVIRARNATSDHLCYLPLLEELGYVTKHKYSFAPGFSSIAAIRPPVWSSTTRRCSKTR